MVFRTCLSRVNMHMSITVHYKDFEELSTIELLQILRLRSEVFIVEQDCVYQDIDDNEVISKHVFISTSDKIVAYLRYFKRDETTMQLGRFVVAKEQRKNRFGRELISHAIEQIKCDGVEKIFIEGQAYLLNFYSSLGFEKCSDVYLLDGIDHVDMELVF